MKTKKIILNKAGGTTIVNLVRQSINLGEEIH